MSLENTLNGAKNAFIIFDAYVKTVMADVGEERAYDMMEDTCKAMGALQGKMSKSQARREKMKEMNVGNASILASNAIQGFGIGSEVIQQTEDKITIKVGKCPVYEAAKMMGLDLEMFCRRSAIPFMNSLVKELNPDLQYELEKFRTGQDDFCEESITLIK